MTEGLSRKGFDLDLRDGQMSEGMFGKMLALDGGLVEVKQAHHAHDYGSVFVELFQTLYPPPRPSGLSVTQAEWWVWDLGQAFMVLRTDEQRRLTCLAYDRRGSTWGGDYNKFLGVRVDLKWLIYRPDGEPRSTLNGILAQPTQAVLA